MRDQAWTIKTLPRQNVALGLRECTIGNFAGLLAALLVSFGLAVNCPPAMGQTVGFFPQTTHKIVQLTGDTDQTRRIPTLSLMNTSYGVANTDLGSTFEHKGKLYFLFGDTPSLGGDQRKDFLAWTTNTSPQDVVLNAYKSAGVAQAITIPGVSLSGLEVPSYGISVNGSMYLVATTDATFNPDTMGRSVMAVSQNDGQTFQKLYDLSVLTNSGKFINVSMVEVNGQSYANLPAEPCVLIWGSGQYRKSNVYLAYVPSAQITNRAAIRYLSGVQGGTPQWSTSESAAVSLFTPAEAVVGEFSVAYCQQLGQWIMLYNVDSPPQIHMRSAGLPWGAWSPPTTIFDGWQDNAYGEYIHVSTNYGQYDVFSDSPLVGADTWGGPYGPYLIPRFFNGDSNRVTIVYTMSTWNPYQAILMQSDIGYTNLVPPEVGASFVSLPGDTTSAWSTTGSFLAPFTRNGIPYVTSYAANGDADMGVAQHGFLAGGSDRALDFSIHGGDAEVVLIEQTQAVPTTISSVPSFYTLLKGGGYGRVVETIIGPQNNGIDVNVHWDLRRHNGKMMRLFVIDSLNRPWGFISVSQVTRSFSSVSAGVPANDNFAAGALLSGAEVFAAGNNIQATAETSEPKHAGVPSTPSVWYQWVAPSGGNVTINIQSNDFDTVLAVYTGSSVNTLTPVRSDHGSSGAGASTLTFAAIAGTTYRIAVAGYCGAWGSFTLHLIQPAAPVFSSQPVNISAVPGSMVTFSSLATATPSPAYQWLFYGTAIVGATNASYVIANAQPANTGIYSVVAVNSFGSTTSAPVALNVLLPPMITTHPASVTLIRTNYTNALPVMLSVAANGDPPLFYQWRFNGGDLPGATNPALTLPNVTRLSNGLYSALVTNLAGSALSSNALVRVRTAQRFAPPWFTPGAPFRLRFLDDDGELAGAVDFSNLTVQATTNLLGTNMVWVTLTNGFSVVNGMLQLDDAAGTNLVHRYYRVIER